MDQIELKNEKKHYVRKRDGTLEEFNPEKVYKAIWKAAEALGGKDKLRTEELTEIVKKEVFEKYVDTTPTVDNIQDIIEKTLIENGHAKTAKAYILYRKQHDEIRNLAALLEAVDMVDDYLSKTDWRVLENANMSYSLQGLNHHVSSAIMSKYWLNKIYPPVVGKAHMEGDFHIHNLDTLGSYCVGWDLRDLLVSGFGHVRGKVDAKPPKHFRTALGQIVNFMYTLQGEAAGAQALSDLDVYLAPFIRYDGLSYKEVKQAMQEFVYNMNVPTRVGFQTPFTNITMSLEVPETMKNEAAIVGGNLVEGMYGDMQEEIDMINQSFAEVMMQGDASGRVFTFPIPTYNITKEFDWEREGLQKIFEMTARYGIPYFSNYVNSDMKPEDARSMCCRLRLDKRELKKRGGGLFGANPLTGSIGVVTLNMAKIGYLSKDENQYFERLGRTMDIARDSLEIKRKVIERFTEMGVYPYSKFYLREVKKRFNAYWQNHFSTIGLIGMNESMMNFMGSNIASKEGQAFAIKVLDFMRDRIGSYQDETNNLYNLEATPGEGTSYRLARTDKQKYPEIIVANEEAYKTHNAQPFYTNSTQLPVDYTDDVFEALSLQDELQTRYTGGTVLHMYLGERLIHWESARDLIKTVFQNFKLPYVSITPTFSICPAHGYLSGEHFNCPICEAQRTCENDPHTECEVYSRVVGFLRPVNQWNPGKQAEFHMRKTYDRQLDKSQQSLLNYLRK